ncbi:MAG TPA: DUF6324 family protein [Paenirhodobacter sp.]
MSINKESEVAGDLQIGPTTVGMVRIYVVGNGFELPFDFEPEEAEDIAEELLAAAEAAREIADREAGKPAKPHVAKGRPHPKAKK